MHLGVPGRKFHLSVLIVFLSLGVPARAGGGPAADLFQTFPRTPGYGPFIKISDKTPQEMAPGEDGRGVLLLGRKAGSSRSDLDYYYGEDFSQVLPILEEEKRGHP